MLSSSHLTPDRIILTPTPRLPVLVQGSLAADARLRRQQAYTLTIAHPSVAFQLNPWPNTPVPCHPCTRQPNVSTHMYNHTRVLSLPVPMRSVHVSCAAAFPRSRSIRGLTRLPRRFPCPAASCHVPRYLLSILTRPHVPCSVACCRATVLLLAIFTIYAAHPGPYLPCLSRGATLLATRAIGRDVCGSALELLLLVWRPGSPGVWAVRGACRPRLHLRLRLYLWL